jgi:hypothetical protein
MHHRHSRLLNRPRKRRHVDGDKRNLKLLYVLFVFFVVAHFRFDWVALPASLPFTITPHSGTFPPHDSFHEKTHD